MRCQEVRCVWDKKNLYATVTPKFLNFWGKTIWGYYGKRATSKRERAYQSYKIPRTCADKADVKRIEHLAIRSAHTKRLAQNKRHWIFSVHWKQENVVVSFHHDTSCTIVLSSTIIVIIRIYTAWSVQIRSFSGPYFPAFGLTGKYGPEKTSYLDTFHVV